MYNALKNREIDILVGTQMVAKGFDFPEVAFSGAVSVDSMLNLPDFRSGERVFQLLLQVAGRTGRADRCGRVVIQTFSPEHPAVKCVKNYDADGFYKNELKLRKEFNYPPFTRTAQVIIKDNSNENCIKLAKKISGIITENVSGQNERGVDILGPAPAPLSKIGGKYRYSIILKGSGPRLNFICAQVKKKVRTGHLKGVSIVIDPVNIL